VPLIGRKKRENREGENPTGLFVVRRNAPSVKEKRPPGGDLVSQSTDALDSDDYRLKAQLTGHAPSHGFSHVGVVGPALQRGIKHDIHNFFIADVFTPQIDLPAVVRWH